MSITSVLIVVAAVVLARMFLWDYLDAKLSPAEGEGGWKDFFTKSIPTLIIEATKYVVIVVAAILLARILSIPLDRMPDDSIAKFVFLASLSTIGFAGLDSLVKKKVGARERFLLWGLYVLAVVSIAHFKAPDVIRNGPFLLGAGIYIMALFAVWTLSYWSKLQNGLAIPIGFAIACLMFVYERYVNTGEMYFNFKDSQWTIAIWPFLGFLASIFVISLVFWKPVPWRQRTSYWVLSLVFFYFLVNYSILVGLLLTNQIDSHRIVAVAEYNRIIALDTRVKQAALERGIRPDVLRAEMETALREVKTGVADPAIVESLAQSNMRAMKDMEERRAKIYENRPSRIYLQKIFWQEAKRFWNKYLTPLAKEAREVYQKF